MNASRPQPPLGDLESPSFAEQNIRDWDRHILECDLGMAVWRVIIAEHGQQTLQLNSRRVHRNQDHRLLFMTPAFGICLAHENDDLTARIAGPRCPPLPAVDDIVLAIPNDT